jgi:cytochrome c oxidase assembly factor CtaG
MASNEPGTFQDADFWNLLQSTIISSMGSLALAIGFFLRDRKKIAHWSTAYTIACLIWVVSLICGIVSVAIYTLINTAWSSMMSTLSSVLALLAPLLLILASTPEVASAAEPAQGGKQKRE